MTVVNPLKNRHDLKMAVSDGQAGRNKGRYIKNREKPSSSDMRGVRKGRYGEESSHRRVSERKCRGVGSAGVKGALVGIREEVKEKKNQSLTAGCRTPAA